MPPIDKAKRRDERRRKAIDSKFQNVRYRTLRAGDSLVTFEAERKTKLRGKTVRKVKRRK
jgi:hypothetical protein